MAKQKYRYLIRPDGTIRVVSKNEVKPQESDTLVTLTHYYKPGKNFWDFDLQQMVAYTTDQLAERRRDRREAQASQDASLTKKRERLQKVLSKLTPDQREAVELIAEIASVDLTG